MKRTLILGMMWIAMMFAPSLMTAQAVTDKNSVTGVVNNPCGEAIDYVGDFHTVSNYTKDAAGGQHITGLTLFKAKGVGQISGDSYSMNEVFPFSLDINGNGGFTLTSVQKVTINHHGNSTDDDYSAHGLSHLIVDANGVVTLLVDNLTFGCK